MNRHNTVQWLVEAFIHALVLNIAAFADLEFFISVFRNRSRKLIWLGEKKSNEAGEEQNESLNKEEILQR